jgi:C-terminal processing protease CtpA/Prc
LLAETVRKAEAPIAEMKRFRKIPPPTEAVFVNEKGTYPTYIFSETILDKDKKKTKDKKHIAYMYLNTFSPSGSEESVIKEVAATLKTLQTFGVKDLIIDTLDNGGGSLSLGLKLAQLFSNARLTLPSMQFKVSDTWLDEFERKSLSSTVSDSERVIAEHLLAGVKKDQVAGLPLSTPWTSDSLFPFESRPNTDLDSEFKIVLLVNEMCASMCDIFAATMVDNRLATLVGTRTMGAGGNVVLRREAPNSHMMLNVTESMFLRRDGSYLENHGPAVDIPIDVSSSVMDKYEPVKRKAVDFIMGSST